jgi:hypothetical protein
MLFFYSQVVSRLSTPLLLYQGLLHITCRSCKFNGMQHRSVFPRQTRWHGHNQYHDWCHITTLVWDFHVKVATVMDQTLHLAITIVSLDQYFFISRFANGFWIGLPSHDHRSCRSKKKKKLSPRDRSCSGSELPSHAIKRIPDQTFISTIDWIPDQTLIS